MKLYFQISAYLSVTVYIEDVNDNVPTFIDTPYEVTVDELTPTGKLYKKNCGLFYFNCRPTQPKFNSQ